MSPSGRTRTDEHHITTGRNVGEADIRTEFRSPLMNVFGEGSRRWAWRVILMPTYSDWIPVSRPNI